MHTNTLQDLEKTQQAWEQALPILRKDKVGHMPAEINTTAALVLAAGYC